jgi:hypothetical protein
MRALGLTACGLLLAACTSTVGGTPEPARFTSTAALGDLRTVDYCTLLDPAGGEPVSSFERCTAEVDGLLRAVGPLREAESAGTLPYDYPGDLPDGVRILVPEPENKYATCTRLVAFTDAVWLTVAVSEDAYPAENTDEERCAAADDLLAAALAAIDGERVGHLSFGRDSFGRLDACELLTGAGVGTDEEPWDWPAGHNCYFSEAWLEIRVDEPSTGRRELLGDRPVMLEIDGGFCDLVVERPSDRPGLVEAARFGGTLPDVLDTSGLSVPDTCPRAWAVAEQVVPRLPQ